MTAPEKVMMPRYRCVHCRRSWANRSAALEHAGRCWYDPANRACKTCVHFTRNYHGEDDCALNVAMPLIERRGKQVTTLAVNCSWHRVRDAYINPDVLDAVHDAAHRAT